jgi:hypothetical protein
MGTLEKNKIPYTQLVSFVDRLSFKEKEKLFEKLKNERIQKILSEFQLKGKKLKITFEEITQEVEKVRYSRYVD